MPNRGRIRSLNLSMRARSRDRVMNSRPARLLTICSQFTIYFSSSHNAPWPLLLLAATYCSSLLSPWYKRNYSKHSEMPVKELTFITGNPNKLVEVKAILGDTVLLTSKSLDLPEIQGTIEEIAQDKCRRATDIVGNSFSFCTLQSRTEELPG